MRFQSNETVRSLSPEETLRELGVDYVPGLVPARGWPGKYRRAAADWSRRAEAARSEDALRALRERLAAPSSPPCFVAEAGPDVGRGLFAERPLKPGTFIGEYAGVLTKDWEPVGRGRFNPYLLKYPFECAYAIDAETRGNELRFANHSARGANAERLFLEHEGLLRALILARAPIAAGAQILLDYGPDYRFPALPRELVP